MITFSAAAEISEKAAVTDGVHPGSLATGGIFALSRNPIYLCFDIFFAGTFLVEGSPLFLLLAIVMIVLLHALICREERFLKETYGQEYLDYCSRTKRYLTF